ncbi:mannosyl transferase [Pyrenophora seminiperda CCB06]|uniref:Mannosyl transferase n=1 Tax=Pyrenophora seminiperda CCB06 TaxID=1302712 RepID=A0A3M7MBY4_9PLEO|nr:mannosyl transferase [Pyrenophora seminiperda CCB06]
MAPHQHSRLRILLLDHQAEEESMSAQTRAIYLILILLPTLYLARILFLAVVQRRKRGPEQTVSLEKNFQSRPFTRPPATPHPTFSLTTTPPLPYRPFRHGPRYNITLGLRRMHWDDWIELDSEYLSYHRLKAERISSRGEKCIRTAPEAREAAVELLVELGGWLAERYPGVFSVSHIHPYQNEKETGGEDGRKGGMVVRNLATEEVFDIDALTVNGRREDPMSLCARLVQDDLAIMMEGEGGQYFLKAGAILLPGFWRLEDKFGMGLGEIHESGDVPGFKEKLEKPMTNFFRRLTPDAPMLRNNYFIQVDDDLAWSSSIGPEDSPHVGWFTAEQNRHISHHMFRSERQSLRRLPRTGAVVFTIRTYFHPITAIAQEPYVPGRLASAIRSWGDDVSRYKGKEKYGDVLLEYLDRMHEEQVAGGLDVDKEDDVRAYPF